MNPNVFRYMNAALVFTSSIIAGVVIGHFLGEKFGLSPWLTVAGLALGLVTGFTGLYRLAMGGAKDRDKKNNAK